MRAQVTSAEQGMSKPTGWHIHKCQAQLVYMLSGWVDLEFEDRKVRISAGDSIMIPGGTPHNETGTSDTFELLEVSVPADMGTEPCPPRAKHTPSAFSISAACKAFNRTLIFGKVSHTRALKKSCKLLRVGTPPVALMNAS